VPGEYIFEFERWPRVIFSSFPGGSTWHVSLKLLAYLIYRRRDPLVERPVGQRFKPDPVVLKDDGRVRLWFDCGEMSIRKLEQSADRAERRTVRGDAAPARRQRCRRH